MLKINPKNSKFLYLTAILAIFLIAEYSLQKQILTIYDNQRSIIIEDRNGEEISIKPNQKGYWSRELDEIPSRFKELLIKKEDKSFYYHFGFNPWSMSQAILGYLGISNRRASSTITQQLVKITLEKEFERSLKNKTIEAFYTLGLEIFQSKEKILKMYVNSIYFGNQAQGLTEASQLYFNLPPDLLTDGEILQLLSTISSPSENNPTNKRNEEIALSLAQGLNLDNQNLEFVSPSLIKENVQKYSHFNDAYFELNSLLNNSFQKKEALTIDKILTEKIRKITERNIEELKPKNAKNGAVVVIKLPENELLAMIGSPDPQSSEAGYKINMLNEPRPIGSTIKPFVYLKAFEKGLRPYTLVDDREYKYITAIGFPLYPKNFDYKYRGEVNLHYALSNSLNVPAVKVLEYLGLEDFYKFLEKDLEFQPVQDLENYQLGIALGVLEMSLLDLSKYFTIFPNNGVLKELKIRQGEEDKSSSSPTETSVEVEKKESSSTSVNGENSSSEKKIAQAEYIQLINKILNDRKTGIEQFGLKSDFNLFQENYALKTGTSRDFHDSWVVGFTPDFLVGVWMGNADNTPMEEISGQVGAGRIWAEVMELLLNSEYNKKTPFQFNLLKEFYRGENIEYGLAGDDYEKCQNVLKEMDLALILNPHQGDVFLLEKNSKIILAAKESAKWFINGEFLDEGINSIFTPTLPGQYQITAENNNGFQETITIWINE